MATVQMNEHARVAKPTFDDFVRSRPDEETWELIDGHFLMQAQPSVEHQLISGNVERLLNDGLEREGIARFAIQATTIKMGSGSDGSYVPDVAVLDAMEDDLGRNQSRTCFLAVEVVSPSDGRIVPETGETRLAMKVRGYRGLRSCEAILVIEQGEPDVTLHVRCDDDWRSESFTDLSDEIVLPSFALRCTLRDIYSRTRVIRARPSYGP